MFALRHATLILFVLALVALDTAGRPAQGPGANEAQKQGAAQKSTEPARPPRVLSLDAYRAELDRWLEIASTLQQDPSRTGEFRKQVPGSWVVVREREQFRVPAGWLDSYLAALERSPRDAKALLHGLRQRVEFMRGEAEAFAGSSEPGEGKLAEARAALDEVLSRSEFAGSREPTWSDRVSERIADALIGLIERVFGLTQWPRAGPYVAWALIALGGAVLLLWIYRLVARVRIEPALKLEGTLPPGMTWRQWAQRALAAAARGAYRDAIHHAYWTAVWRLADLGVWKLDRTRTHREYLRILPAGHPYHSPMGQVTRRFESVWYGGHPVTENDFRETIAHLEQMECLFGSIPATAKS